MEGMFHRQFQDIVGQLHSYVRVFFTRNNGVAFFRVGLDKNIPVTMTMTLVGGTTTEGFEKQG